MDKIEITGQNPPFKGKRFRQYAFFFGLNPKIKEGE
jgi:hypothetical protein